MAWRWQRRPWAWTASLRRELSREIKTKHVSRCAGKGLGRPLVEETENKYSEGWPVSPGARRAPGGGAGAGTPRRRDRVTATSVR